MYMYMYMYLYIQCKYIHVRVLHVVLNIYMYMYVADCVWLSDVRRVWHRRVAEEKTIPVCSHT